MREAYGRLHELGYAHSVESYQQGVLVGGLYGVSLGHAFFGESMFADVSDEQELITGERQEGIIFSARSFAFKAGGSLASGGGGAARLDSARYQT